MNYPYAVGQIKAMENSILNKNDYSKLMKTDKELFLKTLGDMGYGQNQGNLEEAINRELYRVRQLLDEITPQKQYTDLFFLASDALNIKALYKEKTFSIAHFDIYQNTGTISKEALRKAILEEDLSLIPDEYRILFDTIGKRIKDIENPRIISARIDNTIFSFIMDQLRNPQAAMRAYFESTIDFSNVLTFIRSQRLNWEYSEFLEMFLERGSIDEEVFRNSYQSPIEAVLRNFRGYYNEKVTKALKEYYESKDLDQLERRFTMLSLEIAKEYQYDSFGIGPILYYYLKKQAEAKNLRLIFSNKDTDLIDLLDY